MTSKEIWYEARELVDSEDISTAKYDPIESLVNLLRQKRHFHTKDCNLPYKTAAPYRARFKPVHTGENFELTIFNEPTANDYDRFESRNQAVELILKLQCKMQLLKTHLDKIEMNLEQMSPDFEDVRAKIAAELAEKSNCKPKARSDNGPNLPHYLSSIIKSTFWLVWPLVAYRGLTVAARSGSILR